MLAKMRQATRPVDTLTELRRFFRIVAVVLAAGIVVKVFFLDTVAVLSGHMTPAILKGDRIVFLRTAFIPPASLVLGPSRGSIVLFKPPHRGGKRGCLRVAALSGDSISVSDGIFTCDKNPAARYGSAAGRGSAVPADFSPRDNFGPYRLPAKGTVFDFSSLSQRDLVLAASLAAQENPGRSIRISAGVSIDDSLTNEYIISGFPIYEGPVSAIPDELRFDWFFWGRLREYLRFILPDRRVELTLTVTDKGKPLPSYVLKSSCVFLLADNWNAGYDSRYFGPVCRRRLYGKAAAVAWSLGKGADGRNRFRANRIGRIIR